MFKSQDKDKNEKKTSVSVLYYKNIVEKLNRNQASVFVGAGFSKNAIRDDGTNKMMPDWTELRKSFIEVLGYDNDNTDGPLALAQQIEEVYGKSYLNNLLEELMENDKYVPGKAHEELLKLPWQDIFTTNYDDLLEKAARGKINRKYRVVDNQSNLLFSANDHRIIKLHGSFTTAKPYIISEEDYRRYPKEYAPFVNTVQQALLENLFVLIGFSGDDPNFTQWIGWIHDNLGIKNSPRMYLISHHAFSDVKTKMLSAKNIDVVVLDDIPQCAGIKDYSEALLKFLESMQEEHKAGQENAVHWNIDINTIEKFEADLEGLQKIHADYPGWVFVKHNEYSDVEIVLSRVEMWINKAASKETCEESEFEIVYEYCWLCNKDGYMPSSTNVYAIHNILKRHFEEKNNDKYLRCMLFIVKCFRFYAHEEGLAIIEELTALDRNEIDDAIYAELKYEEAMYALYTLRWSELDDKVRKIPIDNYNGEIILKKAYLLSMLGYYEEALNILQIGIDNCRKILLNAGKDSGNVYIRFLSLDSTMRELYGFIVESCRFNSANDEYDKKDNDNYISKVWGDGYTWSEENNEFLRNIQIPYKITPTNDSHYTFDVGTMQTTTHFGGIEEIKKGMRYILFRETTGMPFRLGVYSNSYGMIGAIERINWVSIEATLCLSLIIRDSKTRETAIGRGVLNRLPSSLIDELCASCMKLYSDSLEIIRYRKMIGLQSGTLLDSAVEEVPELLSRLLVKCSDDICSAAIKFLKIVYDNMETSRFASAEKLARRLIKSASRKILIENMDVFFSIDVHKYDIRTKCNYPDPFLYLSSRIGKKDNLQLSEMQLEIISNWIDKISNDEYKLNAITRLMGVYGIYAFPPEIENRFVDALMAVDNLDKNGLPNMGDYFSSNILLFSFARENKSLQDKCLQSLLDRYKAVIESQSRMSYANLLSETELWIEQADITCKQIETLCRYFTDFVSAIGVEKNSRLAFDMCNSLTDLNRIDEILGRTLLKAGISYGKNKSLDDNIIKIKELLNNQDCATPLLEWYSDPTHSFENIKKVMFQSLNRGMHNANVAMYLLAKYGIEIDDDYKQCLVNALVSTTYFNSNSYAIGLEYLCANNLLTEKQYDELAGALNKLEEITRIELEDSNEDISKKLLMRQTIMYLARALNDWYVNNGKNVPASVENWKNLALDKNSEEFNDIKRAWER